MLTTDQIDWVIEKFIKNKKTAEELLTSFKNNPEKILLDIKGRLYSWTIWLITEGGHPAISLSPEKDAEKLLLRVGEIYKIE